MKLRDVYTDWRIVAGLALTILGASNWTIGLHRTQQWGQIIANAAHARSRTEYRSFDELGPGEGGAVLAPLTAQEREVSYATARMDFYHATFISGQVMVMAGLVLTFLGIIATIQSDSRAAMRRSALSGPPGGAGR